VDERQRPATPIDDVDAVRLLARALQHEVGEIGVRLDNQRDPHAEVAAVREDGELALALHEAEHCEHAALPAPNRAFDAARLEDDRRIDERFAFGVDEATAEGRTRRQLELGQRDLPLLARRRERLADGDGAQAVECDQRAGSLTERQHEPTGLIRPGRGARLTHRHLNARRRRTVGTADPTLTDQETLVAGFAVRGDGLALRPRRRVLQHDLHLVGTRADDRWCMATRSLDDESARREPRPRHLEATSAVGHGARHVLDRRASEARHPHAGLRDRKTEAVHDAPFGRVHDLRGDRACTAHDHRPGAGAPIDGRWVRLARSDVRRWGLARTFAVEE
jgi:hypothetical protein